MANLTLDHIKTIVQSVLASATRYKPNLSITDPDDPRFVVGAEGMANEVAKAQKTAAEAKTIVEQSTFKPLILSFGNGAMQSGTLGENGVTANMTFEAAYAAVASGAISAGFVLEYVGDGGNSIIYPACTRAATYDGQTEHILFYVEKCGMWSNGTPHINSSMCVAWFYNGRINVSEKVARSNLYLNADGNSDVYEVKIKNGELTATKVE